MKRLVLLLAIPALFALVLIGCGGGGGGNGGGGNDNVQIFIFPTEVQVEAGGTQPFEAEVLGTTNTTVTWSVQEGAAGGTIVPTSGMFANYTAPSVQGFYHVVVTSNANPSKKAIAVVEVSSGDGPPPPPNEP